MALASILFVAACAHKAPVTDDFSDLAGQDEKSDAFSYRMKLLGSLDYGQSAASAKYTHSPRYRAYKFGGNEGDRVDVWVRSNDGDAVAWVLDNSFQVVASNDDADDTTLDAHVVTTLPASDSITHYIVYRDYSLATAHFSVDLAAQPTCTTDDDCVGFASGAQDAGDTRVAQCDFATSHCQLIAPEDIRCGGFMLHTHQCPAGYTCHYQGVPDIPGTCVAQ